MGKAPKDTPKGEAEKDRFLKERVIEAEIKKQEPYRDEPRDRPEGK